MSINSQMYAGLAEDSYDVTRKSGVRGPDEKDYAWVDGIQFKVLEQYDNPKTGYQGTVYQRVDSGEIVVGHCGAEFGAQPQPMSSSTAQLHL